jgi:glycosyltransferase involved in cell wall biosynthesis
MDPKITVITVVRNDEKNIEKTILSILSQDYLSVEYIIIDGESTDQTGNIIQKYSDRITRILREPDQNMFDAMNKGVELATGKWINFMNSGDSFANSSIISEIFSTDKTAVDLIYGNSIIEFLNGKTRLLKVNNKQVFWKRYINHQSIFTKTQLLKDSPFNITYDLCSDFDFLIHLYHSNKNILSLEHTVSVRSSGGRSDMNRIRSHLQKASILINLNSREISRFQIFVYIFYQIFMESIKSIVKFLLFRSH